MAQLRPVIPEIRARGGEVIVVGNGSPAFARAFVEDTGLETPLYVDERLEAYAAAGLRRGVAATFNPASLGAAVGAFRRGLRQGRVQGDAWQQGGVLVVLPGDRLAYHHANRHPADHAPHQAILAALSR